MWPFKRKESPPVETRSAATGYTAEIMSMRQEWISGRSGLGELCGSTQTAISLWESILSYSQVDGTDLLTPQMLALTGRQLALHGEALFFITPTCLVPCTGWEISTKFGQPRAYRAQISESHGAESITFLAGEALHFVIGSSASAPWCGSSPLKRASITASLLHELETSLSEIYANAPLGSAVLPMPESQEPSLEKLGNSFRSRRGRILLRESVSVTSAGGPQPQSDWNPAGLSPDLSRSMTAESLAAARDSILSIYGVLPSLLDRNCTGPQTREAERFLCQFVLQPICNLISAECSEKLDSPVTVDCLQPLCAFDLGQRSRSLVAVVEALAKAKESGIDLAKVLPLVNWDT